MSRLVLLFLVIVAVIGSAASQGGTWKIDPNHSTAQFAVRHLGISTVRGSFTKVSGTATYDPADPNKDSVDVSIDTSSVDTRVEKRDNDIRSPHFLDVQKYPTITFKSKRAKAADQGKLQLVGDLTIHGITKEVVLDVDDLSAPIKDPLGNERMGASATTKIIREDFGVNADPGIVGDEITITIDTELIQPATK